MKFFLIVLLLISFLSLSYGQEFRLWNETFAVGAAATDDSEDFNYTDDFRGTGKFLGLFAVILDPDSNTTVCGDDDSLYFVPMYKISGTWFTGDTIQWDNLTVTAYGIDDAFTDSNQELIVAEEDHGELFIWVIDPTSTTTIEGYPVWQDFKMRMLHNDSINVILDVRAGRH